MQVCVRLNIEQLAIRYLSIMGAYEYYGSLEKRKTNEDRVFSEGIMEQTCDSLGCLQHQGSSISSVVITPCEISGQQSMKSSGRGPVDMIETHGCQAD